MVCYLLSVVLLMFNSESVSVLFITMSEVRAGLTRQLSVRTWNRLNVRATVLQPLLDAVVPSGSLVLRPLADVRRLDDAGGRYRLDRLLRRRVACCRRSSELLSH